MTAEVGAPTERSVGRRAAIRRALLYTLQFALTLGCVAGVAVLGRATHWKIVRPSAAASESVEEADWCKEHGVPDSQCVECRPRLMPRGPARKWCKEHGVPECPLCDPGLAQLPYRAQITDGDRERAARGLAAHPHNDNDKACTKHSRRIQIVSTEMATRLGLEFTKVSRGELEEVVSAPGNVTFDPTRVARVGVRAPGTIFRVERRVGEQVKRGDVLAVIDSADVGRAKADFQQALVQLDLHRESLANMRSVAGSIVPGKAVVAAEAAVEESEVKLVLAGEHLRNLGLPVSVEAVRKLDAAELARAMRFLGFTDAAAKELGAKTLSNNLLPVVAPLDGEVITHAAVVGEGADPKTSLFVVADTSQTCLTLRVRPEDVGKLKPQQAVRFRHTGHTGAVGWDEGSVAWVSPAADEKTRTVAVRVNLTGPTDRHRENTFGTADVVLRREADALLVPSAAVHWDGCCHVVFVQNKDWGKPGAPLVFHVRKVRPGARVQTTSGPQTEIVAGLLSDEVVAAAGSGHLRSELLKNDLGEGCACCAGK